MKKLFAALIVSLTFAFTASAHHFWVEDVDGQLVVRFAEWPDEYEVTPGNLDMLDAPNAWAFDAEGKPSRVEIRKERDSYRLIGAATTNIVQAEIGFSVMGAGATNRPIRKPMFYARWHTGGTTALKPTTTFDIVPTGKPDEFQVFFRGAPVPAVKVTSHMPDGEEKVLTADDKGIVQFKGDKPGIYMLSCAHQRETVKAYANGEFYDTLSHNCAISWRKK
jgi:hypothetical protein